jgi:asparagine synthase (glutamine-hydrolysing)
MSGIAGAFGSDPVDLDLLRSMAGRMVHRGQFALAQTSRGAVALLRREGRSAAGPFLDAGRDCSAVFEGELFNAAELAQRVDAPELGEDPGLSAALVARLHARFGARFLELLEGHFTLAVTRGGRLLLARDPIGVRPLYLRRLGPRLLFASEAKALLVAGPEPSIDSETVLERYVLADHVLGGSTFFDGVQSLAAGAYCTAAAAGPGVRLRLGRYRAPSASSATAAQDLPALVRQTVERNIRHYVRRYDRVGVLLSGGFDSSVIAALARQHAGTRLTTFTIGDSANYPDVRAARQVARHLGSEHHEIIVNQAPDERELHWGIHAYEDLNYRDTLFMLARRMAGAADLALSGSGADLLGVPVMLWPERLRRARADWQALSRALRRPAGHRITAYMQAFLREMERDPEAAALRHFVDDYIPNQLLPSTERALSYWGLEAGFPFADRTLLAIARLVGSAEERKRILREAFADLDLPEEIKARPKLCSKYGLARVKAAAREARPGAAGVAGDTLGGLLRSSFQVRCFGLLKRIFIEQRGALPSDLVGESPADS